MAIANAVLTRATPEWHSTPWGGAEVERGLAQMSETHGYAVNAGCGRTALRAVVDAALTKTSIFRLEPRFSRSALAVDRSTTRVYSLE